MNWSLPTEVEIDGELFNIRGKCDYRVILDIIELLNDDDVDMELRIKGALFIFYEDFKRIKNYESAAKEMMRIINIGEEPKKNDEEKPKIMDWSHDFPNIAPPVSRVLGYSVRDPNRYTHWYDFIGAFREIGECSWSTFISIRRKKMLGKRLEKWEQDVYREYKEDIDLPLRLSEEERDWLDFN